MAARDTALRAQDRRIAAAARAYLARRVDLMGAAPGAMLDATRELDAAFHELIVACGIPCVDCGCWHEHDHQDDDDVAAADAIDARHLARRDGEDSR